jgi:uncharacterized protein YdaU (DUF1376 family)
VNYYVHHLGDYARDTGHLSALEHGVYRLLLDQYYIREKPLPPDRKEVYKLARAATAAERKAVDYVLAQFFIAAQDGWRNRRCDEEIEKYRAGEPARDAKRAHAVERQRRTRERRAQLFEQARHCGIDVPWNVSLTELERLLVAAGHAPVTRDSHAGHGPVTDNDTASHSPFSILHSEDPPKPPAGGGLDGHTAVREKSPERQRKDSSRAAWVKAEISRKANDFEGLKQRDPLIAEAIRLIGGFHAIGMTNTDRMGTMRARFRETFEQLLERESRA